jgi:protein-L-isoaspartate(D-aspartate) O-methyltransferase
MLGSGSATRFLPSSPQYRTMPPTPTSSDSYQTARDAMVAGFARDRPLVDDPRVIAAMRTTPRHRFVPEEHISAAYEDHPLPIGYDQTISQPSLVAYMTQLLEPKETDRVLEIGTGSGYQAAVLSSLVAEVFTIEIIEPLAKRAKLAFSELGLSNLHCRTGDGDLGWPEAAPFQGIIVTCAPEEIPKKLIEQLAEGGRMIIPVGPKDEVQELYLLEKRDGHLAKRVILPVVFVPMTGNHVIGP